jgi:hypothetical protein
MLAVEMFTGQGSGPGGGSGAAGGAAADGLTFGAAAAPEGAEADDGCAAVAADGEEALRAAALAAAEAAALRRKLPKGSAKADVALRVRTDPTSNNPTVSDFIFRSPAEQSWTKNVTSPRLFVAGARRWFGANLAGEATQHLKRPP